eukprot:15478166-Alexandrium_andersonii.AAC.1
MHTCGIIPHTEWMDWHPHIARSPKRHPQSAECSPMLQPSPIRNPPCGTRNIASSVRIWKCAGPRTASELVPEAPEGCALRHFSRRLRHRQWKQGLTGSEV